MSHTMLCVKDKDISVISYINVFGMSLIYSRLSAESDHRILLHGLPGKDGGSTSTSIAEGLLNLVW
jgi:hypothetical protein